MIRAYCKFSKCTIRSSVLLNISLAVIIVEVYSRVVTAAWLWCRRSPEGREFKAGLRHPATGKLSLSA